MNALGSVACCVALAACGSKSAPPPKPGPVGAPFGKLDHVALGMTRAEVVKAAPGLRAEGTRLRELDSGVADYTVDFDRDRANEISIAVQEPARAVIDKAWGDGLVPTWKRDDNHTNPLAYFDKAVTTRAITSTLSPRAWSVTFTPVRALVPQITAGLTIRGVRAYGAALAGAKQGFAAQGGQLAAATPDSSITTIELGSTEFGRLAVELEAAPDGTVSAVRLRQALEYRGGKGALVAALDHAWGMPAPDQIIDDIRGYAVDGTRIVVNVKDDVAILTIGF